MSFVTVQRILFLLANNLTVIIMITKESRSSDSFSDMLFSVLAHDLRQPFATLITTVDMMNHTRRNLSPEELHVFFEDIRDMSLKSIELLDGMICWMKSKKEGFTCQMQPLPLNDLIQEANSLFLYDQLSHAITVKSVIPSNQLICAHKQMIQFINRNILSNATKYSKPGSIIDIACSVGDDWITVAFTDRGCGIRPHELAELFNSKGVVKTKDDQFNGAGIALSMCLDMISQMNGKLWAESVPDQGATFYYSLPVVNY